MTDEKTSTRALTGRRQMHKQFPAMRMSHNINTGVWTIADFSDSFRFIDPAVPIAGVYSETYFDTSGYTRDYLTTMSMSAQVQDWGKIQVLDTPQENSTLRIFQLDIMTTDRLTVDIPFRDAIIAGESTVLPGAEGTNTEWEQVLYARMQELVGINQGTNVSDIFTPINVQQFGSMGDTTADKIWLYRIFIVAGLPAGSAIIRLPNGRHILNIDVVKEDTLPYLMRQKRSYELAQ